MTTPSELGVAVGKAEGEGRATLGVTVGGNSVGTTSTETVDAGVGAAVQPALKAIRPRQIKNGMDDRTRLMGDLQANS
jgi:hypothetical protein